MKMPEPWRKQAELPVALIYPERTLNNTDDHLRNHGFLYERGGWRLAPLFDVNPNPNRQENRQTALGGHTDAEGSLQVLEQLEQQL